MNSKYTCKSSKPNLNILFSLLIVGVFAFLPTSAEAAISTSTIIQLTNNERASLGLGTLTENPVLTAAAQSKANDMAARGYFSHNTPEGRTPWQFMDEVGYKYTSAAENLAVDYVDNAILVSAWMNSPGHRANIVNGTYSEIGVAYAQGVYQGRNTIFVVQMFGVPKASEISTIVQTVNIPTVQPVKSEVLAVQVPAKIENISSSITPVVVEAKENINIQKKTVVVSAKQSVKPTSPVAVPSAPKQKPMIQIAKAETNDVLGARAAKVDTTTEVQKNPDSSFVGSTSPLAKKETVFFAQIVEAVVNKIIKIVDAFLATVLTAKN